MGEFVTHTGLNRKTLQDLRVEFENKFKLVFGVTFETAVDSPNGLLVSQLALSYNDLWELAQEIYSSLDPNQAVGAALDARVAFNGISRKPALPCIVDAVLYTDKNTEYVFHFTFGDVTLNNSTSASNIAVLATAIHNAGGYSEITTRGIVVRSMDDSPVGITGSMPSDFIILAGKKGSFTAVNEGLQTCEIGELDTIAVGVSGWNSVYNYVAGDPGEDLESDESLRVRREAAAKVRKSKATDPATEAALLDVPGVTTARVFSNRGFDTNADGVPGKSFVSLVVGGTDADVARCIYENQPSGIQSWGNTTVNVTDSHGFEQQISFSRPTPKYLWVKFYYRVYDEEVFPGEEAIKKAMVEWAEKQYTMGKDVIPTRIPGGIYELVAGVGVAMAYVALTDSPDTVPSSDDYSWGDALPILPFEYAVLEDDRIETILEND